MTTATTNSAATASSAHQRRWRLRRQLHFRLRRRLLQFRTRPSRQRRRSPAPSRRCDPRFLQQRRRQRGFLQWLVRSACAYCRGTRVTGTSLVYSTQTARWRGRRVPGCAYHHLSTAWRARCNRTAKLTATCREARQRDLRRRRFG
jgi:hypothetical protein